MSLQDLTNTNSKALIAGWGKMGRRTQANILQFAQVKLHPVEKCKDIYSKLPNIKVTDNNICAGGVHDVCMGDSGGPLTCFSKPGERHICGIVSWGKEGCIRGGAPGLYTDVSAYQEWIVKSVQG